MACVAGDEPLAITGSEITIPDPHALPQVPGAPLPAGYGTYCSVTDPTNGGWAFTYNAPNTGDPCIALGAIVGPNTVVQRAGLWAVNGENNAMVRCDGGGIGYGRAYGQAALDNIYASAAGGSNCIITIAPTQLPVWGAPYDTTARVQSASVFDYNLSGGSWNIAQFGMTGGDGHACAFDRSGFENRSWNNPACQSANPPAGQPNLALHYDANEGAYDWTMARDTPILAVADGVIRKSWQRIVWPMCIGGQGIPYSSQLELFLETQVGSGQYAEHFIAAYHHMDANPSGPVAQALMAAWGGPMPPDGTVVKKGQIIGFIGESGCASPEHLDFSVERLTNLTGGRAFAFQAIPTSYTYDYNTHTWSWTHASGVNGNPGQIDPFGWAAPQGVDPLSYSLIGLGPSEDQSPSITDRGAFSINMFDTSWFGVFWQLPHNGGYPS